ncbi:TPA: hypothetical protein DIC20_04560 [Candidatus Dependentiae bacterium]|nr:MAG: hypothetical protein US03_C0011G0012 [candidate division TM6 bacterium GW2011_GWF2_36_131]KKQ02648.1 MAG: hypothetical protein US13_C0012G0026 [candidate division TM6 bacterium GW2011_GWE2_36_25]KKQ17991.1 MAG: hypothetical protein US32_C0033G0004 [candidate division TM6 bacterium GW2011_GWA2_36_9]HBR70280.1 hypothetical protein [Candidatus Dependentiae bacterium]HCU00948.1 hypothetical protein [Candidatus Dependentiae bacterium]
MKFLYLFLFFSSLHGNEFVVKKAVKKTSDSRATLREKIARSSGDLLECCCTCIRNQTKKVEVGKEKNALQVVNSIVDFQEEFLAIVRQLIEQDNRWKGLSRVRLQEIAEDLIELQEQFLEEHDLSWWQNNRERLKKAIPQK